MKNILCTTSSFGKSALYVLGNLKNAGFNPVLNPYERKLSSDELSGLLQKYQPVGLLAGTEIINSKTLNESDRFLKVISRVGVGWDNVDRKAADKLGIKVFRTQGVLNNAVAELTLGLILSALRNISRQDREIRAGIWNKHMGTLLHEKTVGIIGFGANGKRVGELCHAFGCRVIYSDLHQKECAWGKFVSLDELLVQSDIITLHADGSTCMLGVREIARCRQEIVLINTARGGLIDEDALLSALRSGQVGYACLDVFDQEPYSGPLTQLENVIMTSHIGSYAQEARIRMEEMAVENMLSGLLGLGVI